MARTFDNILSDSEMTIQQKVNAINSRFLEIVGSAPESVRADLEKLKNIAISGISDIESSIKSGATLAGEELTKVAGGQIQSIVRADLVKLGEVVSAGYESIPLSALEAFDKLEQFVEAGLLDTNLTVKEKVELTNQLIAQIGEGVEEEVKTNLDVVEAAIKTKIETLALPFSNLAGEEVKAKVEQNFQKYTGAVVDGLNKTLYVLDFH
jgi:hypothetical protein